MITSKGYDGLYKLVDFSETKVTVESFFDNHKIQIQGGRAPHKPSSTGRVWVRKNNVEHEYFPGVYNLKWVRV